MYYIIVDFLYRGSLLNSVFDKLLILFHISLYFFNTFLSLAKRFTYLLSLLKFLEYPIDCRSSMHKGDQPSTSCIYQI